MLNDALTTNEVKNSSGTEVEFNLISGTVGRTKEWSQKDETPNLRHRLSLAHRELGNGEALRRQSKLSIFKEVAGASGVKRRIVCNVTCDLPVGDLANTTEAKNALAELMSVLASTGASTTILYDCTGNGANALITGSLV